MGVSVSACESCVRESTYTASVVSPGFSEFSIFSFRKRGMRRLTAILPPPSAHRSRPFTSNPGQFFTDDGRPPRNEIDHALRPCDGRGDGMGESGGGAEEERCECCELHDR